MNKVFNCITHIKWTVKGDDDNQEEEGGITWLELYILCKMHSPEDEEKTAGAKNILQKEMADF